MTSALAIPEPGLPLSADEVTRLEAEITRRLPAVDDGAVLMEWRAQAAALENYLRGRELQGPMLGAQRRIEARVGQLLGGSKPGPRPEIPVRIQELDDYQQRDFRLLARALSGEVRLLDEEWRKSRAALVELVRNRLGLMPATPALPDGQYACIVADPPWQLTTGPNAFGTSEPGNEPLPYPQMELGAIAALDVASVAAADAHLYLWTTNKYLRDSYGIAEKWGFRPSVVLTWCKAPRGVGLGGTFRLTTEFILFARRGNHPHSLVIPTTWFQWPRGRHSAKPDAFYELAEAVTPGPRIDLFARRRRRGWDVWGDEVTDA